MRIDTSRLLLITLFALFLSACKTVTVTNPVANQVYSAAPALQFSFPKGKPDQFVVTLNDKDITSLLSITDTGATGSASAITAYLKDGENFLRVTKPATPTVKFTYDMSGPMVHVTKVTEDASLNIQGYVDDPSGVKSVTVNGAALTLASGNTFNVNVTNSSYVTFASTDNLNYVRTQKFARPNVTASNSVSLRVNRNGLDFITNEAERLLESDSLGKLLAGMNPIKSGSVLVAGYKINVKDADLVTADLNLAVKTSADGSFAVSGNFTNIWAKFGVVIDWFLIPDSTIDGTVTLDSASFTGNAKVTASADGKVNVSISSLSLSLKTLRTDINNFPDWLLTPFYDAFKWLFEIILADQLKQIVPAKMTEMLDTFPSSLLIDVNGNQLKPSILPSSIASPGNGLNIGLGARLYNVTTNGPKVVGSAWKDTGNAPAASNVSPSGIEKDIGVVISSNVINQALSAATASGMLNIALTENDIPGLGGLNSASVIDNVRVRMVPSSAPTMELIKSSKGLGTFRMHDLYLALDATIDATNTLKLVMGATIDVEATVDLGVTDGNALAIEFVGTPRIKIRSIDNASSLGLAESLAQTFMDELTPKVLPVVMSMIGAVPLPSFEGYGLSVGDIWVTDSSANFIGIVANMVKTTVTAKSPAPATYAYVTNSTVASTSGMTAAKASSAVQVEGSSVMISLENSYNPSEGNLQYRYSVDGATFSPWKERNSIKLYGLNGGLHEVTICSRTALLVEDTACTSVSFYVNK